MGEHSSIEWTDHTFNPWIGCQHVSEGCDFCYAETLMDKRLHRVEWGPHGKRRRTSESNWREPLAWDIKAAAAGRRDRVFCASLADVFDMRAPVGAREDLFRLIADTPNLIWMLLTKRPQNMALLMPMTWGGGQSVPTNVWLGITAENQAEYERRWPLLSESHAPVRFVSYEPALGPLDISQCRTKPDWIICGGESGPGARPMHPDWARSMRDQCQAAGVSYLFKQWGDWAWSPDDMNYAEGETWAWVKYGRTGKDSVVAHSSGHTAVRLGKKLAGRLLDGREWDQMPA